MTGRVLFSSQCAFPFFPAFRTVSSSASRLTKSVRFRHSLASFSNCNSHVHSGEDKTTQKDPFVITTPLYYVNAPPHMGSAYTTIAADAIARFQRLLGKKVIFITGTDEHGEKIATAAAAHGCSPSEHCDAVSESYRLLWKDLDVAYDKFIRTTDPIHERIVREFYEKVLSRGDIYRADYEGLYCVNCEEYKDEKELLENNCCPVHLKPCVLRKEDNYFFALSKYHKSLEEVFSQNPNFIQPSFRSNEVQGWINSGLRDFSISRASVEWGIPVPNDKKQTVYVWFDALLGYISALLDGKQEPTLENAISLGWPASLHLIGKDILRFHAVYWPAMLMSAGLNLPKMVFGHGFLTKDGMKMGKSLGNTLEPKDLVNRFGSDAVRYFFLREVEFGNDGDYSEERFINTVNGHLANTIGNLLNRTLGLMKKNCNSTVAVDSAIAAEANVFKETVGELVEKARAHYENLSLSSACECILEIANAGNLYMDKHSPWSLFKKGGASSESAAKDLVIILEAVRIISVALSPVAPQLCLRIHSQLGYSEDTFEALTWEDTRWGGLKAGQIMAQPKPVFERIELKHDGEDESGSIGKVEKEKKKIERQMVAET
ncbi:hypothetical protein H6P81_019867 [Aristolochia fimbriata]|uniref:methionine--tRNA ligase n=1 Tax=Aristolochia fimbriata TaxID=158543 RepID=A0AAV7DSY6_ARIFI|nr:hypothetical protein H6P81_019867 [Aristolochia fimbriata]